MLVYERLRFKQPIRRGHSRSRSSVGLPSSSSSSVELKVGANDVEGPLGDEAFSQLGFHGRSPGIGGRLRYNSHASRRQITIHDCGSEVEGRNANRKERLPRNSARVVVCEAVGEVVAPPINKGAP